MGKPNNKIKDRDKSFKQFCIQSKLGVQAISIMFWDELDSEISWALTSFEYLSDNNNFISLKNHLCRHKGKWRHRTIESQNGFG